MPKTIKQPQTPLKTKPQSRIAKAKKKQAYTWEVLRTKTGWTTLTEAEPHSAELFQLTPDSNVIIQETDLVKMTVSKSQLGPYTLRIEKRKDIHDAFELSVIALVRSV